MAGAYAFLWISGELEGIAVFSSFSADLTHDGFEPSRVRVMEVGDGYFPTVRVTVLEGRIFQASDHVPGSERFALLGEKFLNSRYGSNPGMIGRAIRINDVPCTIVGTVPVEAAAPGLVDVWTPMQPDPNDDNLNEWDSGAFTAIARLKQGETLRTANTILATLADRVAEEHPPAAQGIYEPGFASHRIPYRLESDPGPLDSVRDRVLCTPDLIGISLLAIFIPASRAAAIEPWRALQLDQQTIGKQSFVMNAS